MRKLSSSVPLQTNWRVVGALGILGAIVFFWPYLGAVFFSGIMAFIFYPLYARLARRLPPVVSMVITTIISIAVFVIPMVLAISLAVFQGVNFANKIADATNTEPAGSPELQAVVANVDAILGPTTSNQVHLDQQSIHDFFVTTLPTLIRALVGGIMGLASGVAGFVTFATIYLFLFAAYLMNGQSLMQKIRQVSPFDARITQRYFVRTGAMIKASMLGQLLIAFVLAVLTALTFFLIGLGQYFFFWVIICTILNMVPLGSSIVVWPVAIIAALMGNVAGALWVVTLFTFVICSIDNIMRPRLIPKSAQLLPALTSLSIFCGIYYFGILGVVYGPIIVIILVTTFDAYLEYKRDILSGKGVTV